MISKMKIDFSSFAGIGSLFEAKKKQLQTMWGVRHVIAKWKVFMLYHDCFFKHMGAFMLEIKSYKEVSSYANYISSRKKDFEQPPLPCKEVIEIRQKAIAASKKTENPSAAFFEKK